MKKRIPILFILLLIFIIVRGESFSNSPFDAKISQADSLYYLGEFKSAIGLYNDVMDTFQKDYGNNHPKVASLLVKIGKCRELLGEYDLGAELHSRALMIYKSQEGQYGLELANTHNELANSLRYIGVGGDSCLYHYHKAISLYKKHQKEDGTDLGHFHNNAGLIYLFAGKYNKARKYLEKGLSILRNNLPENSKDFVSAYQFLGFCYYFAGDYKRSIFYYEKCIQIALSNFDESHRNVAVSYNDIANSYYGLEKYEIALDYYQKALKLFEQKGWGKLIKTGTLHKAIGNNYREMGRYEEAIYHLLRAEKIYKSNNYLTLMNDLERELGYCYLGQGDFKKAELYFKRNVGLKRDVIFSRNLLALSKLHLQKGNLRKAKEYYDQAYEKSIKKFIQERGLREIEDELLLIQYYGQSAKIMLAIANQNPSKKNWEKAIQSHEKVIKVIDNLRASFHESGSIQAISSKYYSYFEEAIFAHYKLFQLTKDKDIPPKIFNLVEKSKAYVLMKNLKEVNARKEAGLPNEVHNKLSEIQTSLTFLEKQKRIELEKGTTANQAILAELYKDVFALKELQTKLISQLEKDYPEYYKTKYGDQVLNYSSIEKFISPDKTVIEYFTGTKNIFALRITAGELNIEKIALDFPLDKWVKSMREGIYNYHFEKQDQKSDELFKNYINDYTEASFGLYEKLIAPVIKNEAKEKLLIIPDGILAYIPFEALLTQAPKLNTSFNSYKYLLKQKQISYAYSLSFLLNNKNLNLKRTLKPYLGIAPKFDQVLAYKSISSRRKGLGTLNFNINEVENIQKIIGGDVIIGEEAFKEEFCKQAPNYQILHLSTHAKANDINGEDSYIAFSSKGDSKKNELLFVSEIYNLALDADMVVLSACETGIGQLQKGEGILSLARAFSYTGAKSIISSMWSVDDARTKTLMEFFYQNLKQGQAKDEALRNAKLTYLSNNSEFYCQPYFWAGFIPIGDMVSIEFNSSNKKYWWWLFFFLLIFILIYLDFWQKSNNL